MPRNRVQTLGGFFIVPDVELYSLINYDRCEQVLSDLL